MEINSEDQMEKCVIELHYGKCSIYCFLALDVYYGLKIRMYQTLLLHLRLC